MATLTTQNVHAAAMLACVVPEGGSSLVCTNNGANSVALALGFVAPKLMPSARFNDVRFYVSAVSGSPTVTAELWSNSASNQPGSLIEAGSVTCSPTGVGWWECSGFSAPSALTEGTQYWVVLQCTAGTSATINWLAGAGISRSGLVIPGAAAAATHGCLKCHSTDNKNNWAGAAQFGVIGPRLSFTDGTDVIYYGIAGYNNVTASAAAERCYGGQEIGSVFTTPANASFKLRAVHMMARKASNPTGNLRCRLYTGETLTATSVAIVPAQVSSSSGTQYRFEFSTPQTLLPDATYRIVLSNSAADDASNYYYTYKYQIDADAASRALLPFGSSLKLTRLAGSTWTDVDGEFAAFALDGDTDGQFAASGGGRPEFRGANL